MRGGPAFLSENHEYVLVYGNPGFRFCGTEKTFKMYSNGDNDIRGDWRSSDLTKAHNRFERPNTYFPLFDPETETWFPCNPDSVWRYTSKGTVKPDTKVRTKFMEDWIAEKRILFPKGQKVVVWATKEELISAIRAGNVPSSGSSSLLREDLPNLDFWVGKRVGFGTPAFKRFKKDLRNANQPLSSWITPKSEANTIENGANVIVTGTNDEGAKAVKDVFGEKAFNYAKPPSLIRELVRQASSPGDLILDFFAGSATTAQAVMELNAEDDGDRRFIMVSSTEASADEPAKNICRDVTAERVRRLNASTDKKFENLSAEFAYLTMRQIAFEDLNLELQSHEAWAALEAMHDLPLTLYAEGQPFQLRESDALILVYVDRFDEALVGKLRALGEARRNVFVYAWAPGQIAPELTGLDIEVRPVRETLVKRFQQ